MQFGWVDRERPTVAVSEGRDANVKRAVSGLEKEIRVRGWFVRSARGSEDGGVPCAWVARTNAAP